MRVSLRASVPWGSRVLEIEEKLDKYPMYILNYELFSLRKVLRLDMLLGVDKIFRQ